MESSTVHQLTEAFEGHAHQTENGVEYWLARDLQHLLGYSKWENSQTVIVKAKTACEVSGQMVESHFPDVRKMVKISPRLQGKYCLSSDEKKALKKPNGFEGS